MKVPAVFIRTFIETLMVPHFHPMALFLVLLFVVWWEIKGRGDDPYDPPPLLT